MTMLYVLLMAFGITVVPTSAPSRVPASAPSGFDEDVAVSAIRSNLEAIGPYEVTFSRVDERFIKSEPLGSGFKKTAISPPGKLADYVVTWKDNSLILTDKHIPENFVPTSHYMSDRMERKVDGSKEWSRGTTVTDGAWTKTDEPPRRDTPYYLRGKFRRNRLNSDLYTPMDLIMGISGPSIFGKTKETVTYKNMVIGGVTYKNVVIGGLSRLVSSSDRMINMNGTMTYQVDQEDGYWEGEDFKKHAISERWWLDPDKNFMPVRIDLFDLSDPLNQRVGSRCDVLLYKQIAPKVWFPMLGTKTYFDTVGEFSDDEECVNKRHATPEVPGTRMTLRVITITPQAKFSKDEFAISKEEERRAEQNAAMFEREAADNKAHEERMKIKN